MRQDDLITVVIPVYNVEKYLNRCAESILKQTYSNLEIIFVNDGSTDSSGDICNIFKDDKRVKVIHKKNGGLSSARNAALAHVHGKYVTFIDSDDWVESNFIENLYTNLLKYQADISVVGYYIALEDGNNHPYFSDNNCQVMDSEKALSTFLLHDGLGVTVWGKLYRSTLWNTIACPEGKLHEDQYTTYKLLDLANKIVFDKQPLYYYFQRSDSIGHSSFTARSYDLLKGIHEEYDFISKKYPNIRDSVKLERDIWEMVFINMMIRSNINNFEVIDVVRKHIRQDIQLIIKSRNLSKVRKAELLIFLINFRLYKRLYSLYLE